MKKYSKFIMPIIAASLLLCCKGGGGDSPDTVKFSLSSDWPTLVEDKSATVYLDWSPSSHIIKFESFNFVSDPAKKNTITFDKDSGARPLPVKISFDKELVEDFSGDLNFVYDDLTTKTKGEGSVKVTITVPEKYLWYKDTNYLNGLTKDDITKTGGEIKTLKVNGIEHKVRLIGVDEDFTDITKPDETKIHTTWEFVNYISDKNGFSLATQWNDTNITSIAIYNYKEANIRNALNGVNVNNVHWSEKEATNWSTTYNCSVLDMISAENKGFCDVLKKPSKLVSIYNDKKTPNPGFEDKVVNDRLFLLSPREMGYDDTTQEAGTTTYTYYKGHTESRDDIRIKKQVNETFIFDADGKVKIPYSEESGQFYEGDIDNYAGHNPDEVAGGVSWCRSPYIGHPELGHPYRCSTNGTLHVASAANNRSYSVAPAFCI